MTTIGYGDVTPQNPEETIFVIIAEGVGLTVFALLLTNINTFNDSLAAESAHMSEGKDGVLSFLKKHSTVDGELSKRMLMDLQANNFLLEYQDLDNLPLSHSIRLEMKIATVGPELMDKVTIFGRTPKDLNEKRLLHHFFSSHDLKNTGSLEIDDLESLMEKLGMGREKAAKALKSMDKFNTGKVEFTEFYFWYYMFKYGRPVLKWPRDLILGLSCELTPQIFTAGDVIVAPGDYGDRLLMLRDFGVVKYQLQVSPDTYSSKLDNLDVANLRAKTARGELDKVEEEPGLVRYNHTIPLIGALALLSDEKYQSFSTDHPETHRMLQLSRVTAVDTTLVMGISRQSFRDLAELYWPDDINPDGSKPEHHSHLHYVVGLRYGIQAITNNPNYLPQSQKYNAEKKRKVNVLPKLVSSASQIQKLIPLSKDRASSDQNVAELSEPGPPSVAFEDESDPVKRSAADIASMAFERLQDQTAPETISQADFDSLKKQVSNIEQLLQKLVNQS
eukprot:CAMPEP_0175169992 /NCGR_PEP_ID=MMETSP0087-20121206/29938_1 /TAXON_ID=136419 /ORGANISM="Unknown Unknown, Strain D1" /LENGTH=503 /DNA_ID=CAMNT_0016460519 /DNA_START=1 /DNA_END=1512 /DNA_ORIENTATION=-